MNFSRLSVAAVVLGFLGLVTTAGLASQKRNRPEMDPRGEPDGHLKKGTTECFKVWHNEDGWHVRVVNGKGDRDHRYQGTITVENGVMEGITSHLARKNGAQSVWRQGPKKHEVSFDFATHEREDGMNFKVSKAATTIRFALKIDGRDLPDQIFVGRRGDNPESTTFVVDAHPGDRREIKEAVRDAKQSVRSKK